MHQCIHFVSFLARNIADVGQSNTGKDGGADAPPCIRTQDFDKSDIQPPHGNNPIEFFHEYGPQCVLRSNGYAPQMHRTYWRQRYPEETFVDHAM